MLTLFVVFVLFGRIKFPYQCQPLFLDVLSQVAVGVEHAHGRVEVDSDHLSEEGPEASEQRLPQGIFLKLLPGNGLTFRRAYRY